MDSTQLCPAIHPTTQVACNRLANAPSFEGVAAGVSKARRGHSKERRSDCPLVTLAMALDGSGFVRRVQFFASNASEPTTLEGMLTGLDAAPGATVVMDAGIATEANLGWLRAQGYHYVVVSKLRERQFDPTLATEVQSAGEVSVKLQRVIDAQGHVLLYCHAIAAWRTTVKCSSRSAHWRTCSISDGRSDRFVGSFRVNRAETDQFDSDCEP